MRPRTRRRRYRSTLAFLALLALPACAAPQVASAPPPAPQTNYIRVPLSESGGTPTVSVGIAGVCCFDFTVDSGAADVTVTPAVFGGHVQGWSRH